MSRQREYTITCDEDRCEEGHDYTAAVIEMCPTRKEAEEQARIEGWSIGKRDLCPAHRRGART